MKVMSKILYICIGVIAAVFLFDIKKETVISKIEDVGNVVKEKTLDEINWDRFVEAVIWKESRGNENCVGDGGKAVGVLQIHPVMVREANRILRMRGEEEKYTYDDRYNKEKSIEIFNIIQDFHNEGHDFMRALQIWNKNHPSSYSEQIMNKYNELISD